MNGPRKNGRSSATSPTGPKRNFKTSISHPTFPTAEALEALWRPDPAFIGPVAPPMIQWINDRDAQARWRKQVNLDTTPDG